MVGFLTVAIGAVVVILVFMFAIIYNALVVLRNNINKAWGDIDVLLEKRHDMLGKLLDVVKGYMTYEQNLLTQVTALRTQWMGMQKNDVQGKIDNSNQMSQALKSIFATAENYPDLKANASFMQLQGAITDIENQLADRREFYNDAVNSFNIRVQQVPYNVFASVLGYKTMPMYPVAEEEKQDVKMSF